MKPVSDVARICAVMKHPSIWPHITDDLSPADWQPSPGPCRVYLMPDDDSACFVFARHSGAMLEGHLCVMPHARDRSEALGNQALQWLRDNTAARAVIGFINEHNAPACRYVERLGFAVSARIPNAAIKNGDHSDVVFYIKEL